MKTAWMASSLLVILSGPMLLAQNEPAQPNSQTLDAAEVVLSQQAESRGYDAEQDPEGRVPSICKPCVFYSGDFNAANTRANGLYNLNSASDGAGQVWVPFTVVTQIQIQGLFINELFDQTPPATAPATWQIRSGISTGNGGTLLCSGSSTATATATGRSFTFNSILYTEYSYQIANIGKSCTLVNSLGPELRPFPPGIHTCPATCYMTVEPQMSPAGIPAEPVLGFLSDVEDIHPHNHFGSANVNDNSFFDSTAFGLSFLPTWGGTGVCATQPALAITTVGCDMFSVGITGRGK
jgi:hypothetical protein